MPGAAGGAYVGAAGYGAGCGGYGVGDAGCGAVCGTDCGAVCGSSHAPILHTRLPLQSVSFVHWAWAVAGMSRAAHVAAASHGVKTRVPTSRRDMSTSFARGLRYLRPGQRDNHVGQPARAPRLVLARLVLG